jgi:HlyD family secretion protein
VQFPQVTALERDKERLEGERGQLVASIAQVKGKMTETELQILQIDQDMRSEVGKDLADIRGKIAELVEKRLRPRISSSAWTFARRGMASSTNSASTLSAV